MHHAFWNETAGDMLMLAPDEAVCVTAGTRGEGVSVHLGGSGLIGIAVCE
jgi:hypothetical protein